MVPSDLATQRLWTAHVSCRPGIRAVRAHRRKQGIRAGYAFPQMREASGAHQHQGFWRERTSGFHSSVWRSVAHGDKCVPQSNATALCEMGGARHNTQLCSNRLVTEAGLPAEGTAGCMSVLLCRRVGGFSRAKSASGFWAGGTRSFRNEFHTRRERIARRRQGRKTQSRSMR